MNSRTAPTAPSLAVGVIVASAMQAAAGVEPPVVTSNPLREAYYGDLHLHTSYSLDAYLGVALRVDPDTAYRFARGDVVKYLGHPIRRREPLDFLAVTDHAENLGVVNELDDPDSAVSRSGVGKAFRAIVDAMTGPDGRVDVERLVDKPRESYELYALSQDYAWGRKNKLPDSLKPVSAAAWAREIEFANRNYVPGSFTTFIAYEWTAAANGANLHRNVIGNVPLAVEKAGVAAARETLLPLVVNQVVRGFHGRRSEETTRQNAPGSIGAERDDARSSRFSALMVTRPSPRP